MIHLFRRSAPKDQADRLRQLVEDACDIEEQTDTSTEAPPMIVVAGSKGGVGTTTVAYQLAKALAETGNRCVAVDANLQQANLGQLAGVGTGETNIADVMAGDASAADSLQFVAERLWLLPGAWAPATHSQSSADGANRLASSLAKLHEKAEVLVIDAGTGHTPVMAPLWEQASAVLLVATNERLSLLNAYATIKLAGAANAESNLQIVANRCQTHEEGPDLHAAIGQTCQRFLGHGVPLAGTIGEGDLSNGALRIAHRISKQCLTTQQVAADDAQIELTAA